MPLVQRRRYGSEHELGGGYLADEDAPSTALHGVAAPLFDTVRWTVKLPTWCTSLSAMLWRYSATLATWVREQDLGTQVESFTLTQALSGGRVWLQLTNLEGTPDSADPVRKSWQPLAEES